MNSTKKDKGSHHARHIPPLFHVQGPFDERKTLIRVPPDPRERIIGSQLGWNNDRIWRVSDDTYTECTLSYYYISYQCQYTCIDFSNKYFHLHLEIFVSSRLLD